MTCSSGDRVTTSEASSFPIGATVNSFFNTEITRIGYAYSFLLDERKELGIHFGLHVTDISTGITEIAGMGGMTSGPAVAGAIAPLPVIGLQGAWQFKPKSLLQGRI